MVHCVQCVMKSAEQCSTVNHSTVKYSTVHYKYSALLGTTDRHQKTDSVHAKMLTRFILEHIPVFRALLKIEIEIDSGTHPRF